MILMDEDKKNQHPYMLSDARIKSLFCSFCRSNFPHTVGVSNFSIFAKSNKYFDKIVQLIKLYSSQLFLLSYFWIVVKKQQKENKTKQKKQWENMFPNRCHWNAKQICSNGGGVFIIVHKKVIQQ